jgi:hypothetical protein
MGVLGAEGIKRRLEEIFEAGTYNENCIDIASYNLRLDDEELIIDGNKYHKDKILKMEIHSVDGGIVGKPPSYGKLPPDIEIDITKEDYFGIFLVSASIFGVILAILFSVAGSANLASLLGRQFPLMILAIITTVFLIILTVAMAVKTMTKR